MITDEVLSVRQQFPKMKKYSFFSSRKISWGEMDSYGHVNNTTYFRYFEDARIAYLENLRSASDLFDGSIAIVVASTSCKFKLPLTYPDEIVVAAMIDHLDDTRFTMSYLVGSKTRKKIAAQGDALMVAVSRETGKVLEIPDSVKDEIRTLETLGDKS